MAVSNLFRVPRRALPSAHGDSRSRLRLAALLDATLSADLPVQAAHRIFVGAKLAVWTNGVRANGRARPRDIAVIGDQRLRARRAKARPRHPGTMASPAALRPFPDRRR